MFSFQKYMNEMLKLRGRRVDIFGNTGKEQEIYVRSFTNCQINIALFVKTYSCPNTKCQEL